MTSALIAAAVLSFITTNAASQSGDRDWYFCHLAERPYGRTVYMSGVFTPPAGVSETEVETAFEEHVQRHYVREPVAGGLCLGPKSSREEALNDRRDAVLSLRRSGATVVQTAWTFRGSREIGRIWGPASPGRSNSR